MPSVGYLGAGRDCEKMWEIWEIGQLTKWEMGDLDPKWEQGNWKYSKEPIRETAQKV